MGCNQKDQVARLLAGAVITAASLDPEAGHEFLQRFVAQQCAAGGYAGNVLGTAMEDVKKRWSPEVEVKIR